jgi:hypothetical protein
VSAIGPEGTGKAAFGKWDLPNSIRSLLPLLSDLWETRRGRPNPLLLQWGLKSLNHSELLLLELVGRHEDYKVLELIHNGKLTEGNPVALLSAGWHAESTYARESGYSVRQVTSILAALNAKRYIDVYPRGLGETTRKRVNRDMLAKLHMHLDEHAKKFAKTETDMEFKRINDELNELYASKDAA